MTGKLAGQSIVVPEGREVELFSRLLEAEGASAVRCPLVRIVDPDDWAHVDQWIGELAEGGFDNVVLLTGEGLRRLVKRSDDLGLKAAFVAALGRVRTVVRGPKPVRALRELGLAPGLIAPAPTSEGVVAALAPFELSGTRFGIQLYPGHGGDWLVGALGARGAAVRAVTPYRYVSEAETARVGEVIRGLAEGKFDMIAFTSSPQIDRLIEVARELGLENELIAGLKRTKVAAVGPIVQQGLEAIGISDVVLPAGSFHLKPLVQAIIASRR